MFNTLNSYLKGRITIFCTTKVRFWKQGKPFHEKASKWLTWMVVMDSFMPMYMSQVRTSSGSALMMSICLLVSSHRSLVFIFCQRWRFHSDCCSSIIRTVSQTCFRLLSSWRQLKEKYPAVYFAGWFSITSQYLIIDRTLWKPVTLQNMIRSSFEKQLYRHWKTGKHFRTFKIVLQINL